MKFVTLALFVSLGGVQDDVAKHRKELEDDSYGNLWGRRNAARDLGKLGTRPAAGALLEFAGRTDPATREAIVLAIARIRDEAVRRFVLEALPRLKDPRARVDVIWAFRRMDWDGARDGIHRMLRDPAPAVRAEAARTLGALGDPRCGEAAADKRPEVVEQALLAAASLKAPIEPKLAEKLLKRGAPRLQAAALRWKAAVDPDGLDLDEFLKARPQTRIAAADVARSVAPLKTLLDDKDWRVRVAAVAGLERLWTSEAIDALVERFNKEDGRLILDIVLALQRMTGKSLGYDPKNWTAWWDVQRDRFGMPEKPDPNAGALPAKEGGTRASFFNIPIFSRRIVFVIDCSGSMKNEDEIYEGKRKIDVALEELSKAVGGLSRDARFNVIMLSTEATAQKVRSLAPRLVPATPGNRIKAIDLVRKAWRKLENIKRGRGDIYDAVAEAMADPDTDTVVLLTDGKATDGRYLDRDHLIEAFAADHRTRRACIHAVLTGSKGIDEKGMKAFARVTGGIYMPRK